MLRTARSIWNRCATAAWSMSAASGSTTSPRHPAFRDGGADRRRHLRHEGRSGPPRRHDLRGGRRPPLDLFPQARRPARICSGASDGHRRIAEFTYGMFGRSPDHVASFVTGMAMKPDALPKPHAFADNLLEILSPHPRQRHLRGLRRGAAAGRAQSGVLPARRTSRCRRLRVVREDDDGVVISGMKMLATGALYANEIWIGNVIPLAPDQKKEAITCAIPCNAPGLTLWSRKPAALGLTSEFDSPLAWRYDESDSMLMCENVKVPWEKVFVHDDALLSRDIYIKTAEPLLRQPPVQRALLVEDAAAARPVQPDRQRHRRRPGAGGAREARRDGGDRGDHRRAGQRPDQRLRELARGLRLLQPPLHVCRRSNGARRTTAASSTSCARCAAAACSRCRRISRCWTIRSWPSSSTPTGRRRRRIPSRA